MTDLASESNELLRTWQRYDWRESFFAPRIVILQALTAGGRTASGVGRWREAAFHRCLGETAEIHALSALTKAEGQPFQPLRDGLAAHVDADLARDAAALEAFEQFAVSRWWQAEAGARPVSDAWLTECGLTGSVAVARLGAALKRRTGWWQIETRPDQPAVMICRSMSPEGQDPVLGFGCDANPLRAARKALRELFLMEMNLMELLAARTTGQQNQRREVQDRISAYARRGPGLLPPEPVVTPGTSGFPVTESSAADWLGCTVQQRDITPPDGPIRVMLCRPDLPVPTFDPQSGPPFM